MLDSLDLLDLLDLLDSLDLLDQLDSLDLLDLLDSLDLLDLPDLLDLLDLLDQAIPCSSQLGLEIEGNHIKQRRVLPMEHNRHYQDQRSVFVHRPQTRPTSVLACQKVTAYVEC